MHLIEPVDAVFITTIGFMVLATCEKCKPIAFLLFAQFCVFIGFDMILKARGIEMGAWGDMLSALFSTSLGILFAALNARYLAATSGLIAFYHVGVFWTGNIDYYFQIMVGFSILQILGLIPGVYDGYRQRRWRDSPNDRRNSSRYHCIH